MCDSPLGIVRPILPGNTSPDPIAPIARDPGLNRPRPGKCPMHNRPIHTLNLMPGKSPDKFSLRRRRDCEKHQPTGVAVEAVYGTNRWRIRPGGFTFAILRPPRRLQLMIDNF